MYARGGYRIGSCSGSRCEEYYVCIAWVDSERDMSVDHARVHFCGLRGDSEPFMKWKLVVLMVVVVEGFGPTSYCSSRKSVRWKSE